MRRLCYSSSLLSNVTILLRIFQSSRVKLKVVYNPRYTISHRYSFLNRLACTNSQQLGICAGFYSYRWSLRNVDGGYVIRSQQPTPSYIHCLNQGHRIMAQFRRINARFQFLSFLTRLIDLYREFDSVVCRTDTFSRAENYIILKIYNKLNCGSFTCGRQLLRQYSQQKRNANADTKQK